MATRQVDVSGAAEVAVHLLPAQIQHNGPAAVQTYFKPQETGASADGLPLLQCSLRGRSLTGVCLPLPPGFSGAVLERRSPEAAADLAGGHAGDSWAATAAFSHLHYYHHDAAPLKGDGLRRCLEWSDLAAQVHSPIGPAAVAAAAAAAQQAQVAAG